MESKQTLKKQVRRAIIARNTLEDMGRSRYRRTELGEKYLALMARQVTRIAAKAHPLLPYYIITRRI